MGGQNYGNDGFWPRGKRDGVERWLGGEGYERAASENYNAQPNVEVRAVGMVDRFLRSKGFYPRGTSEFLKTCLKIIFEQALAEGERPVLDLMEAIEYLEDMGYRLGQFMTHKRTRIATALRAEHLRNEMGRAPSVGGIAFKQEQPEAMTNMPPVAPEDEYDKWGRWRMDKLLGEGLSEADAIEQAMRECNEKRETDDSEHPEVRLEILIWSFCSSGMTPDGAKMRAEMRLKQEKEMGRRL
jgi:hypothetical protein